MPLTSFRLDVPALADPHMRGPNISTFYSAIGAQLDANAETIMAGRIASNPFAGGPNARRAGAARLADGRLIECEPAALPAIAEQRGIRIYDTEPVLSRRVRISRWWQLHKQRGTHRGEMAHLQPYFLGANGAGPLPMIRIYHTSRATGFTTCHTLSPAGVYSVVKVSYLFWDIGPDTWSEFDVVVYSKSGGVQVPALQPAAEWDGGAKWDDGTIWDGLTSGVIADLVSMILDWKSAHSSLRWFIVCDDESKLDPLDPTGIVTDANGWTSLPDDGNWRKLVYPSGTYAGHNTRPPYLRFIYDKAAA